MLKKKFTKLIGIKKELFDDFLESKQIKAQSVSLIPALKTGDEMALTSIFLSSLRLVKEYRESVFREISLPKSGKAYYYTEMEFPELGKCRIDGVIILVKSGIISEVVFLEMKNKNNTLSKTQIESYVAIAKQLGVKKMVTVSNEFTSDVSISPIDIRTHKNFELLHFSWTHLLVIGQILLFKNDTNIEDIDQIEIMKEVLKYLENPVSGVSGYSSMKKGWKELGQNIRGKKIMKLSDDCVQDSVISWYEKEKDLALLLSTKLGILVKPALKRDTTLKSDMKKLIEKHHIIGKISIKNAVSDVKYYLDFERRSAFLSVNITPPEDKGSIGKISWIAKQLSVCKKRNEKMFSKMHDDLWLEVNIKYARDNLRIKFVDFENLREEMKGKDIIGFSIVFSSSMGSSFESVKGFVQKIDSVSLDFYEGIIQHLSNWTRTAPRIEKKSTEGDVL